MMTRMMHTCQDRAGSGTPALALGNPLTFCHKQGIWSSLLWILSLWWCGGGGGGWGWYSVWHWRFQWQLKIEKDQVAEARGFLDGENGDGLNGDCHRIEAESSVVSFRDIAGN